MVSSIRDILVASLLVVCVSAAVAGPRAKKHPRTKVDSAAVSTARWQTPHPFMYLYGKVDEEPVPISVPEFISDTSLNRMAGDGLKATYLIEVDREGKVSAYLAESLTGNSRVDSVAAAVVLASYFEPAKYGGDLVAAPLQAMLTLVPCDTGYLVNVDFDHMMASPREDKPPDPVKEYPSMLTQKKPGMPPDFKQGGKEASVLVGAYISPIRETPLLVAVMKPSEWPSCDREALEAAWGCTFAPAVGMAGVAVPCWVTFIYEFKQSN